MIDFGNQCTWCGHTKHDQPCEATITRDPKQPQQPCPCTIGRTLL